MSQHQTVLLLEAVDALSVKDNGVYIDGTFGRGGHSDLILKSLGAKGRLLAVDKDLDAINYAKVRFNDTRIELIHADFANLKKIITQRNLLGTIDGILVDLGVSSPQVDMAHRGFSFMKTGVLDMRMDQSSGVPAKDWLQKADEVEISDVLWKYGEERKSRQIARVIVNRRDEQPLETTDDLVSCVLQVLKRAGKKHPATRTFQAIRIFINQELQAVEQLFNDARALLKIGGRLVVISFHSLEDRMVKNLLHPKQPFVPVEIPIQAKIIKPIFKEVIKKLKPSQKEIDNNPRARSAIMRVAERVR